MYLKAIKIILKVINLINKIGYSLKIEKTTGTEGTSSFFAKEEN
jgi:hypothetical protein